MKRAAESYERAQAVKQDSLARAIEALGAVDLGDGRDHAVPLGDRYYLACAADVREYYESDHRSRAFISATWKPMPDWWTPGKQFAMRCRCGQVDVCPAGIACSRCDMELLSRRITVDLNTGEEVPA